MERTYSESGGIGIGQVQHPMGFGIRKAPGRNTRMSSLFFRETSIVGNPMTESDSEELTNRGLGTSWKDLGLLIRRNLRVESFQVILTQF
jgi:hypothetical protein